jgi:4'-phosphopantetheinyl transferase
VGHALVWTLDIEGLAAEAFDRLVGLLDETEVERAVRFRFERDRRSFIAAHGLGRLLLASLTGVDPRRLRYVAEQARKPRLDPEFGASNVDFSLSHTRGFVVVAAGADVEIGADAESADREHDYDAIAAAFFAHDEILLLENSPPSERRDCFFTLWTVKEAVLKAAGFGLSVPLGALTVSLDPPALAACDPRLGTPESWSIETRRPSRRHFLAVAARSSASDAVQFEHVEVDGAHILAPPGQRPRG